MGPSEIVRSTSFLPGDDQREPPRRDRRRYAGAYHALGCRDWSRVDVRLDADGRANVVEVNPLPGILPDLADNSCLPKAARAAGLSYDELIGACLSTPPRDRE